MTIGTGDGLVPAFSQHQVADAPDKHVYIDDSDPIGGFVCSVCGMPVETEPCELHQPIAYARCNS